MKAYQAIPELLRRDGHDVVFGMLGGHNAPWVAEGVRVGAIRLVKTRHEEASGHGAAGYSRATGKLGVWTVTAGPGFANAVQALTVSKHAHIPTLLIVGECPAPGDWADTDVDQRGLSQRLGVRFHHVETGPQLQPTYRAAVTAALRNGSPQVLSIAKGMLGDELELSVEEPGSGAQPADAEAVDRAIDALAASRAPLIVAGQGAVVAGARDAIIALADATGARLATTLRANRLFDGHDRDLGICGGWTPPSARALIVESDVVLSVGASLSERTTVRGGLFADATVITCEIDDDRPVFEWKPDIELRGDAQATTRALLTEWNRRGLAARTPPGTVPTFRQLQAEIRSVDLGHDPRRGLDIRDVYLAFDRALPADRVVVTDSGRVLNGCTLVRTRDAASFVLGRGYGTVGVGLGTAIGAAVGHRGRPVVLFCGDGGFMMAITALDTARLYGLDLTVVILNDEQLGSEVKHLRRFDLPTDVIRQELPDVRHLARAYGGTGHVIRTTAKLDAIRLPQSGITIYDCRLDPEIDPPGMFTFAV